MIVISCILYIGTVGTCVIICTLPSRLELTPISCSSVLGILTCYYSGRPGADFYVGIAPRIAMAYSAVGIAMNFICTMLICGRILYVSHAVANLLTGGGLFDDLHIRGNFSLIHKAALMIMESMLPYTLFGAAYVITLGLISPLSILFLSLYVMFTVRRVIGSTSSPGLECSLTSFEPSASLHR